MSRKYIPESNKKNESIKQEKIQSISSGRKLSIATAPSAKSKTWKQQQMTFGQFYDRCLSPVDLGVAAADYAVSSKTDKADIKDRCGAYVLGVCEGGRRTADAVIQRDAVTLDADDFGHIENPERIMTAVSRAWTGHDWVAYTTVSHVPARPRWRMIVPLSRPVDPDEYQAIARHVASLIDINLFDPASYRHNQLMYWPGRLIGGEYQCVRSESREFLAVDAVLEFEYQDWRDCSQWPAGQQEQDTAGLRRMIGELEGGKGRKRKDPLELSGVVGSFCRAYDIHDAIGRYLGDVYAPSGVDGSRYTYTGGTTANGACVYDDGRWLYSNHQTDPAAGRLCNSFELVCIHLFGDPADKSVWADMCRFAETDELVREDIVAGITAGFVADSSSSESDSGGNSGEATSATDNADVSGNSGNVLCNRSSGTWQRNLTINASGNIKKTLENARLIVANDSLLQGKLGVNELKGRVVVRESIHWPDGGAIDVTDEVNGEPWSDVCDLGLRCYVEQKYRLALSGELAFDAVNRVADGSRFHPVRDYLQGLEWDGVERVDRMLIDVVGCEDTEYSRAVSRKLLVAAVARAMQPGVKFDHMVVLEGAQGKMKSRFCEALAVSGEWYADGIESFHGKESIESLQGAWIVEVPELAVFGKSQIEQVKAFITRRVDRGRMAYARRVTESPRQCVLIGSTNDRDYLKDETGNRRFWPIRCGEGQIRIDLLREMVDQLYAEAYHLWQRDEPLYIDSDTVESMARTEQAARRPGDEWSGIVEEWLAGKGSSRRYDYGYQTGFDAPEDMEPRDKVCALEVWIDCLGGDPGKYTQRESRRINNILAGVDGWNETRKRFGERFGLQRGYVIDDFAGVMR